MPAVVLDSFALLAYLRGEKAGKLVRDALQRAATHGETLAMTELNYAEVKYVLLRKDGRSKWLVAENLLSVLPIRFHPVDRALADQAADFKARHTMSLADACAAALAKQLDGVLYTSDPEFLPLRDEIRLFSCG